MGYSPKGCKESDMTEQRCAVACVGGFFCFLLNFTQEQKKLPGFPRGSIKNFQGFALAKRGESRGMLTEIDPESPVSHQMFSSNGLLV